MVKKKQEALEKKIKKLTNELNKLKEPEFYYTVGHKQDNAPVWHC